MSGAAPVLICAAEGQDLRALRVILREHGLESLVAADTGAAIGLSAASHPAAAIVDLRGGEDGVELTSRLRGADRLLPILVVCGEDDDERGIEALRAGADHLSVRSFGASELIARLDALLRRAGRPAPDPPPLSLDGLEVDLVGQVVKIGDGSVRLTRVESELLRILVEHRGRTVPHRSLLVEIWGREHADDRGLLRSHIFNLRRKIEPPGEHRRIRTEPGVGYRLGSWSPDDPDSRSDGPMRLPSFQLSRARTTVETWHPSGT